MPLGCPLPRRPGRLSRQGQEGSAVDCHRSNRSGQTILMATHEVRSASIADRILFLRDGEIRGELRLADLGVDGEAREAAVLRWLVEQGW